MVFCARCMIYPNTNQCFGLYGDGESRTTFFKQKFNNRVNNVLKFPKKKPTKENGSGTQSTKKN